MTIETGIESDDKIRQYVEQYLVTRQPKDYHLNIVGVKRDGDYYYVVVRPDRENIRSYDYYNILAEVENDIEENEKLNILLVPALPGN